ncbi:CDP-diacylglycerol--glycerol-3-phosphate 3-phosphatidyltransferase [Cystobasidiomycetes sp. EMM_F5]
MHGLLRSFASISYSLLGSSTGPNVDIEWQRLDNRQISPEEDAATAAQQGREVITSFMAEQLVQSRTQDNNNTLDTLVQPFLQMGPYGILQETDTVIPALLTEAGNDEETRLDWTSGYFSVRKSCRQALINTPGPVRIVCAAPESNGFYQSAGFSKYIPPAYTYLERLFWEEVKKQNKADSLNLLEWRRSGWTYHAKGIWLSRGSQSPFLTSIGSSNYGYRSATRDIEINLVIQTSSQDLQKALQAEVESIVEHAVDKVDDELFERPERKVGFINRWAASMTTERDEETEVQLGDDVVGEAPPVAAVEAHTSGSPERATISIAGSSKRAEAAERESHSRELPPSKRARVSATPADAGRQRRLFGVLTKTLTQFKEDTKKDTDGAKRRAAVQERLASKLREENEALQAKSGQEKARRNLKYDVIKKEDERSAFVAIYHNRRANKERLANLLCTKCEYREPPASTDAGGLRKPAFPALPHALAPSTLEEGSTKPLYYLPFKLLPWQADQIDAQVEDMREELDKEETEWAEELVTRDAELDELRAKRDEAEAAAARAEGREVRRPRSRRDRDEMDEDDADGRQGRERAPLPTRERSGSSMRESDDGGAQSPLPAATNGDGNTEAEGERLEY